jgi:hypothetical protein
VLEKKNELVAVAVAGRQTWKFDLLNFFGQVDFNTTLARNLADCYHSFKITLGNVIKDNTAL